MSPSSPFITLLNHTTANKTVSEESSRPLVCIHVSKIHGCKAPSFLCGRHKVTSLLWHVTRATGLSTHKYNLAATTCMEIKRRKLVKSIIQASPTPLHTFSNDLLDSDLVAPNSEGSANEISACMTGPRAATSSSRTRPGAHQLPARIEELPHDVKTTGGVFAASIAGARLVYCAPNYCTD